MLLFDSYVKYLLQHGGMYLHIRVFFFRVFFNLMLQFESIFECLGTSVVIF